MPQIIVIADTPGEGGAAQVMFRERVTTRDFESSHFATQLAERLGWAVGDALAVDHHERAERIEPDADADAVVVEGGFGAFGDRARATMSQRPSARVVTTAS